MKAIFFTLFAIAVLSLAIGAVSLIMAVWMHDRALWLKIVLSCIVTGFISYVSLIAIDDKTT